MSVEDAADPADERSGDRPVPAEAGPAFIVPTRGLSRRRAPVGAWIISAGVVIALAGGALYLLARSQISWKSAVSERRLNEAKEEPNFKIRGVRRLKPGE